MPAWNGFTNTSRTDVSSHMRKSRHGPVTCGFGTCKTFAHLPARFLDCRYDGSNLDFGGPWGRPCIDRGKPKRALILWTEPLASNTTSDPA